MLLNQSSKLRRWQKQVGDGDGVGCIYRGRVLGVRGKDLSNLYLQIEVWFQDRFRFDFGSIIGDNFPFSILFDSYGPVRGGGVQGGYEQCTIEDGLV
jgi:hypothetical protein